MLIYRGTTVDFTNAVLQNRIADIMSETFQTSFGRKVSRSEYTSWQNSCQHIKNLIELARLKDNMVCLEYEVPYNTGRIDCMLFGKADTGKSYTVLMELKQWSRVEEAEEDGNMVETYTGGATRKVAHPSQQVEGYDAHIRSFVEVFEVDDTFDLYSCSYCHNYQKRPGMGLFADKYQKLVERFPVYTKQDVRALADKLHELLAKGDGFEIFNRFIQSPLKPSKKLLENVSNIVEKNRAVFSLLNEQIVAKNLIMSKIKKSGKGKYKSVIVVQGGPGTGKTVIALNILAEAARMGKSVFYGCKSKPFRSALESRVGKESRIVFSNLGRFVPSKVKENELDIVLVDEAHRIERTSNSQYTSAEHRTAMPQVEQLIRCAKTTVFFIDDKQSVRSQEVGSSELIRTVSEKYKAELETVELLSQFRCAGSDNYLDWLESVLRYSTKPVALSADDRFEFRIVDDPNVLYDFIKKKEAKKPNSARLVAGFCWPWSDPEPEGNLVKDVVIPEHGFAMPWEAKDGVNVRRGIPRWYQWAYKTEAVNQVGCIYTVQGFEFDYIGVIVGPDLKYDETKDALTGDITATRDPKLRIGRENFETYVKNIYRVLMTRGMKGCYVYFCDKKVEEYFRKHIKGAADYKPAAELLASGAHAITIESDIDESLKYRKYLPVYSLKAAAGGFSKETDVHEEGWTKVTTSKKLNKRMFVAQVTGRSMEPQIPDGSYCIFSYGVTGTRQNKIVLVQHNSISDTDTGGRYTVKKYESRKRYADDGTWGHEEIKLLPLNPAYAPILIPNSEEGEFMVIAEFVSVIN